MRRIHAKNLSPGFICTPKEEKDAFGDKVAKTPFNFNGYLVEKETLVRNDAGDSLLSKSHIFVDAPTVSADNPTGEFIQKHDSVTFASIGKKEVVSIARFYGPRMILDYGILYLE